jgi:hypothetical protein
MSPEESLAEPIISNGPSPRIVSDEEDARRARIRVKNRRKTYLDKHPEYFSSELELAGTYPTLRDPHEIRRITANQSLRQIPSSTTV